MARLQNMHFRREMLVKALETKCQDLKNVLAEFNNSELSNKEIARELNDMAGEKILREVKNAGFDVRSLLDFYQIPRLKKKLGKESRVKVSKFNQEKARKQWEDEKIREAVLKGREKWWSDEKNREMMSKKATNQLNELWKNDEYRKRKTENNQETMLRRVKENDLNYKVATIAVELNGRAYKFKSRYELAFALYLVDMGVEFEYESLAVNYFYKRQRKYIPDFYISKENRVYEIKGYVKDELKLEAQLLALREKGYEVTLADREYMESLGMFVEYYRRACEIYNTQR